MLPAADPVPPPIEDWRPKGNSGDEEPTIAEQKAKLDAETIAAFRIWMCTMLAGFAMFLFFRMFRHKTKP